MRTAPSQDFPRFCLSFSSPWQGLDFADCIEKSELRERARLALATLARVVEPATGPSCWICLDGGEGVIHGGCACRGDAGYAHVECVDAHATAIHKRTMDEHVATGYTSDASECFAAWGVCPTCKQAYNNDMELGLSRKRWARTKGFPTMDEERLSAANSLATALASTGRLREGEGMVRDLLRDHRAQFGLGHPRTMMIQAWISPTAFCEIRLN